MRNDVHFLQDLVLVHYNPPKITACELEALYPQDKHIRILDCAAGTGLVGQEVGFIHSILFIKNRFIKN